MIRRLTVHWPGASSVTRILAVSDEQDAGLGDHGVRETVGRVDAVIGCGDLEPGYLAMLGDAFMAPLLFVRGNHDRGLGWHEQSMVLPECLPDGRPISLGATRLVGLSWPGDAAGRAQRDEGAAWRQVLRLRVRLAGRGAEPLLLVSHVPPSGAGDVPDDPYHRGFAAYRWLAERLRPPLWLHGHSQVAGRHSLLDTLGPTTVVNVTGAALVELVPSTGPQPSGEVSRNGS